MARRQWVWQVGFRDHCKDDRSRAANGGAILLFPHKRAVENDCFAKISQKNQEIAKKLLDFADTGSVDCSGSKWLKVV